jgi:hypothetical protein
MTRVTGHALENRAGERGGYYDIVIDEEHVHGTHFFDVLLVAAIQPEHLIETLFLRALGGLEDAA